MSIKHLFLVDDPVQVKACQPLIASLPPDESHIVIAGNGQSLIALEAAGIEAEPSHRYWNWDIYQFSQDVLRPALEIFCADADRLISKATSHQEQFKPFLLSELGLIRIIDTITIKIKELDDLFKEFQPNFVYCGKALNPKGGLSFPDGHDSLYSLLTPLVAKRYPCKLATALTITPEASQQPDHKRQNKIISTYKLLNNVYSRCRHALRRGGFIRKLYKQIRLLLLTEPQPDRSRKVVLAVQDFMDFSLVQEHFEVLTWLPNEPLKRWKTNLRINAAFRSTEDGLAIDPCTVTGLPSFKALTQLFEHDVSEVLSALLRVFITEEIPGLYRQFEASLMLLGELDIQAVLALSLGAPHARIVAGAANALGIPVIMTPHGQIGDQQERVWKYMDLRHADHYILYTPASQAYVARVFSPKAQLHWAGCSRQDKVLLPKETKQEICKLYGLSPDKPLIVYVTIPPAGNCHRLGVTIANTRSYETSKAILDTLFENSDANIIVKGISGDTPVNAPLISHIRTLGTDRVIYVTDMGFVSFIDAADCIVLDHPAYTVTECLTRPKPMYIFNETYHWEPGSVELLREDAVFELDRDVFLARLRQDLASGQAYIEHEPTLRFLRKWVDPYCDGTASQRLATVVVSVIKGEPYQLPPIPVQEQYYDVERRSRPEGTLRR